MDLEDDTHMSTYLGTTTVQEVINVPIMISPDIYNQVAELVIKKLEENITKKKEDIQKLETDIEKMKLRLEGMKGELEKSTLKVATVKNSFNHAYKSIVKQINEDINKIEKYIKS